MASATAYKPVNDVSFIPLVEKNINSVPSYEDSGVKYQGKFKTQQTSDKYELRSQETRFFTLGIGAGAFGSNVFTRARPQTKFFCTKMIIQHAFRTTSSLALGQIRLADVKNSAATTKFYYYPTAASGEATLVVDFSDSPRGFEGDSFDIYTQYAFGANEFLIISLFGWEEQQ
jgi:hypothetical protein